MGESASLQRRDTRSGVFIFSFSSNDLKEKFHQKRKHERSGTPLEKKKAGGAQYPPENRTEGLLKQKRR